MREGEIMMIFIACNREEIYGVFSRLEKALNSTRGDFQVDEYELDELDPSDAHSINPRIRSYLPNGELWWERK